MKRPRPWSLPKHNQPPTDGTWPRHPPTRRRLGIIYDSSLTVLVLGIVGWGMFNFTGCLIVAFNSPVQMWRHCMYIPVSRLRCQVLQSTLRSPEGEGLLARGWQSLSISLNPVFHLVPPSNPFHSPFLPVFSPNITHYLPSSAQPTLLLLTHNRFFPFFSSPVFCSKNLIL